MAAVKEKYVRIKSDGGRTMGWHREMHITSDLEVFESDVPVPERIPDLVEWMFEQQAIKNDAAVAEKTAAAAAAKAAKAAA